MTIRKPAVANQFYPGNPQMLKQSIMEYLEKARSPIGSGITDANKITKSSRLKAIISPHAGYIYSGWTAAYAYKLLKGLDQDVTWKVLLLGPSHHVPFYGAAAPEEDKWKTPFGLVDVKDIRSELKESEEIIDVPEANSYEHSLEVQVPFLQMVLKKFVLYPLVLGNLKPKFLAGELAGFAQREDVIVVVSSDLSHFLKYSEAKKVDMETSAAIYDLDIMKMSEMGDACGKSGILTLMNLAKELGWKCEMLNYKNSGDTAGDMNSVVGYGAFAFYL
jgi:hypothetical protein